MRVYPGISMVTLGVADVDRSGRFYERLGWRRSQGASNAQIAFFALNNIVLALFGRAALAQDCGLPAVAVAPEGGFSGVTLAQNYGSEAAVDLAYDQAVAAGAKALREPERAQWGGYHAILADPDGHVWELAYNPFFELSADGTISLPS